MKQFFYFTALSVLAIAMAACAIGTSTSASSSTQDSAAIVEEQVDTMAAPQEAEAALAETVAQPQGAAQLETNTAADNTYNEQEAEAFATMFIKQGKPLAYRLSSAKKFMTPELYAKCKSYTSNTSIENESEEPYLTWGEEDHHITRPGVFVKSLGNGEFCGTLSEVSDFAGDEGGYSNRECTIIVDKVDGEYKVVNIYNYMKKRYEL